MPVRVHWNTSLTSLQNGDNGDDDFALDGEKKAVSAAVGGGLVSSSHSDKKSLRERRQDAENGSQRLQSTFQEAGTVRGTSPTSTTRTLQQNAFSNVILHVDTETKMTRREKRNHKAAKKKAVESGTFSLPGSDLDENEAHQQPQLQRRPPTHQTQYDDSQRTLLRQHQQRRQLEQPDSPLDIPFSANRATTSFLDEVDHLLMSDHRGTFHNGTMDALSTHTSGVDNEGDGGGSLTETTSTIKATIGKKRVRDRRKPKKPIVPFNDGQFSLPGSDLDDGDGGIEVPQRPKDTATTRAILPVHSSLHYEPPLIATTWAVSSSAPQQASEALQESFRSSKVNQYPMTEQALDPTEESRQHLKQHPETNTPQLTDQDRPGSTGLKHHQRQPSSSRPPNHSEEVPAYSLATPPQPTSWSWETAILASSGSPLSQNSTQYNNKGILSKGGGSSSAATKQHSSTKQHQTSKHSRNITSMLQREFSLPPSCESEDGGENDTLAMYTAGFSKLPSLSQDKNKRSETRKAKKAAAPATPAAPITLVSPIVVPTAPPIYYPTPQMTVSNEDNDDNITDDIVNFYGTPAPTTTASRHSTKSKKKSNHPRSQTIAAESDIPAATSNTEKSLKDKKSKKDRGVRKEAHHPLLPSLTTAADTTPIRHHHVISTFKEKTPVHDDFSFDLLTPKETVQPTSAATGKSWSMEPEGSEDGDGRSDHHEQGISATPVQPQNNNNAVSEALKSSSSSSRRVGILLRTAISLSLSQHYSSQVDPHLSSNDTSSASQVVHHPLGREHSEGVFSPKASRAVAIPNMVDNIENNCYSPIADEEILLSALQSANDDLNPPVSVGFGKEGVLPKVVQPIISTSWHHNDNEEGVKEIMDSEVELDTNVLQRTEEKTFIDVKRDLYVTGKEPNNEEDHTTDTTSASVEGTLSTLFDSVVPSLSVDINRQHVLSGSGLAEVAQEEEEDPTIPQSVPLHDDVIAELIGYCPDRVAAKGHSETDTVVAEKDTDVEDVLRVNIKNSDGDTTVHGLDGRQHAEAISYRDDEEDAPLLQPSATLARAESEESLGVDSSSSSCHTSDLILEDNDESLSLLGLTEQHHPSPIIRSTPHVHRAPQERVEPPQPARAPTLSTPPRNGASQAPTSSTQPSSGKKVSKGPSKVPPKQQQYERYNYAPPCGCLRCIPFFQTVSDHFIIYENPVQAVERFRRNSGGGGSRCQSEDADMGSRSQSSLGDDCVELGNSATALGNTKMRAHGSIAIVQTSTVKTSTRCPLTLRSYGLPARTSGCRHEGAFDLYDFVHIQLHMFDDEAFQLILELVDKNKVNSKRDAIQVAVEEEDLSVLKWKCPQCAFDQQITSLFGNKLVVDGAILQHLQEMKIKRYDSPVDIFFNREESKWDTAARVNRSSTLLQPSQSQKNHHQYGVSSNPSSSQQLQQQTSTRRRNVTIVECLDSSSSDESEGCPKSTSQSQPQQSRLAEASTHTQNNGNSVVGRVAAAQAAPSSARQNVSLAAQIVASVMSEFRHRGHVSQNDELIPYRTVSRSHQGGGSNDSTPSASWYQQTTRNVIPGMPLMGLSSSRGSGGSAPHQQHQVPSALRPRPQGVVGQQQQNSGHTTAALTTTYQLHQHQQNEVRSRRFYREQEEMSTSASTEKATTTTTTTILSNVGAGTTRPASSSSPTNTATDGTVGSAKEIDVDADDVLLFQ